jgi:hypothetical protein
MGATPPRYFEKAVNDAVEFASELIQAPQRGHGAFLDASGFIPIGLDKLDVAAGTGGDYLEEKAITLSHNFRNEYIYLLK